MKLSILLLAPQAAHGMVVAARPASYSLRPAHQPVHHVRMSVSMADFSAIADAPMEPVDTLSDVDMVSLICEGLKQNDTPRADAGIERLFQFLTPMGRVAVAPPPPRSGLQGGVELDYFMANAASTALGSLMFCINFKIIGEPALNKATQTRGALCTICVEVENSPVEDDSDPHASLQALVNAPDDFLEAVLAAHRNGTPMPSDVPEVARVRSRYWFSLEQQRRPPQIGCWLLKEMLPVKKTKFQALNEGGEEFEGDDSG